MNHTQEPWNLHKTYFNDQPFVVEKDNECWVAYSVTIAKGNMIIGDVSMDTCNDLGFPRVRTKLETDANARRIIACVNACAGISTEELEQANSIVIMK